MKFHTVNGHLAVKTASSPEHVHSFHEVWHELSSLSDERDADVELIRIHDQLKSNSNSNSEVRHPENASASDMAPSMASLFAGALPRRGSFASSDDASCQAAHSPESMAVPPRSNLDGGAESLAESRNVSMRARDNPEVREQARKIQQVPDIRKEVEVGPRLRAMGGSTAKSLPRAAASTVFHGGNSLGQKHTPALSMGFVIPRATSKALAIQRSARPKNASGPPKRSSGAREQEEGMSDDYDWSVLTEPETSPPRT